MTFHEMVLKNLKNHTRKYLSFFLCNSFAIMVLFMFLTLLLSRKINQNISMSTRDMLKAITIAIIVFIFGFLNYAYWTFVKGRRSEFGLFQILGMTPKDLKLMIIIENGLIILFSLALGLAAGSLFSRLFFMASTQLLDKSFIGFQITFEAYGATILVFLIIYLLMNLLGNISINKTDLIDLLRFQRKKEKSSWNHNLMLLPGILLVLSAYFVKYAEMKHLFPIEEASTKFVLLLFPGLYLIIAQLGNSMDHLFSSNRVFYTKRMMILSELRHKLSQNKVVIYLMCILSALIMFFLGDAYTKYLYGFSSLYYESTGSDFTVTAVNRLIPEEGLLLLFISSFLAVLFFISAACMINFKLFNDLDAEKRRYQQLFRVGITKIEVSRYLSAELKLLFFVPLVVGSLIVYPFIIIENLTQNRYQEILGQFTIMILFYIVIQTGFYFFTRRRYVHRIAQNDE